MSEGPRLLLGGHVHDPERHWDRLGDTWSLNAGYGAGATSPSYYSVDLARGVASHWNTLSGETDIKRLW